MEKINTLEELKAKLGPGLSIPVQQQKTDHIIYKVEQEKIDGIYDISSLKFSKKMAKSEFIQNNEFISQFSKPSAFYYF